MGFAIGSATSGESRDTEGLIDETSVQQLCAHMVQSLKKCVATQVAFK